MDYKGHELDLPLSDELRAFLVAKSKDTLIAELDAQWANIENAQRVAAAEREADGEDGEDADFVPYSQWTKDELLAEIKERNTEEGRVEPLPTTGNKADLVAALELDDE